MQRAGKHSGVTCVWERVTPGRRFEWLLQTPGCSGGWDRGVPGSVLPSRRRLTGWHLASAGVDASASQAGGSTDVAAVVVPILFLILLSLGVGFAVLYAKHRRLQSSFTAFANSHYSSRLGSAIFSSGDDLGKWPRAGLLPPRADPHNTRDVIRKHLL